MPGFLHGALIPGIAPNFDVVTRLAETGGEGLASLATTGLIGGAAMKGASIFSPTNFNFAAPEYFKAIPRNYGGAGFFAVPENVFKTVREKLT